MKTLVHFVLFTIFITSIRLYNGVVGKKTRAVKHISLHSSLETEFGPLPGMAEEVTIVHALHRLRKIHSWNREFADFIAGVDILCNRNHANVDLFRNTMNTGYALLIGTPTSLLPSYANAMKTIEHELSAIQHTGNAYPLPTDPFMDSRYDIR